MRKYTKEDFFSDDAKKAFIEREAKLRGRRDWPVSHWYTDEDFCELYRLSLDLLSEKENLEVEVAQLNQLVKDHEEAAEDKRQLTKEISDILHQNSDGPKQPSLCDVLAYVRDDFEKYRKIIESQGYIYEDDLPDYIDDEVFELLFSVSKVDGVRMYPKMAVESLCDPEFLKECATVLKHKNAELLDTLKRVYRKYHCGDDDIGSEELNTEVFDTLCRVIGEDEFNKWAESERV